MKTRYLANLNEQPLIGGRCAGKRIAVADKHDVVRIPIFQPPKILAYPDRIEDLMMEKADFETYRRMRFSGEDWIFSVFCEQSMSADEVLMEVFLNYKPSQKQAETTCK